jgi:hypothetical protein
VVLQGAGAARVGGGVRRDVEPVRWLGTVAGFVRFGGAAGNFGRGRGRGRGGRLVELEAHFKRVFWSIFAGKTRSFSSYF